MPYASWVPSRRKDALGSHNELLFEAVAASLAAGAGEADGVDHPFVSECGGGDAVLTCGFAERGEHDRGGDAGVCGGVQCVAGVVVEPADDLDVGAGAAVWVGEPVVGEVGLPGLVGLLGFEADVGGLGSLGGVRGHLPGPEEDAVDGGPGQRGLVVMLEVPLDGI